MCKLLNSALASFINSPECDYEYSDVESNEKYANEMWKLSRFQQSFPQVFVSHFLKMFFFLSASQRYEFHFNVRKTKEI